MLNVITAGELNSESALVSVPNMVLVRFFKLLNPVGSRVCSFTFFGSAVGLRSELASEAFG